MEYLFIYLIGLANSIRCIAAILAFVTSILITLAIIIHFADDGQYDKDFKKMISIFLPITIVLLLVPSRETLILLGGYHIAKKTVINVQQSAKWEKINKIIDLELDKYILELKNTNNPA